MDEKNQHRLYMEAGETLAPAIARLARAVERDPDRARDLEQDMHCEIFRSLARYDERCSLKTWVYRVAHNVAADHRQRWSRQPRALPLDAIEEPSSPLDIARDAIASDAIERAHGVIRTLPTLDAQLMLLWLEGESAKEIAEVTGLSPANVATRTHRLRKLISATLAPAAEEETDR